MSLFGMMPSVDKYLLTFELFVICIYCPIVACSEANAASLAAASELLGVSSDQLTAALTVRTIAVPTRDRVSAHHCRAHQERGE